MKFSGIEKDRWESLKPYLDTCIVPLTGLTGREQPWEVTGALEQLGEVLDRLDERYKGRIVIYPALHYTSQFSGFADCVNDLCRRLKEGGFRFVVLVAAAEHPGLGDISAADLILDNAVDVSALARIASLWQIGT